MEESVGPPGGSVGSGGWSVEQEGGVWVIQGAGEVGNEMWECAAGRKVWSMKGKKSKQPGTESGHGGWSVGRGVERMEDGD